MTLKFHNLSTLPTECSGNVFTQPSLLLIGKVKLFFNKIDFHLILIFNSISIYNIAHHPSINKASFFSNDIS